MRPSGLYAVIGGEERHVEIHGRDYVKVAGDHPMAQYGFDERPLCRS